MPGFSTSETVKLMMANGLETLEQNVTDFVNNVASSEIAKALKDSVSPGGFLSGSWKGTAFNEEHKQALLNALNAIDLKKGGQINTIENEKFVTFYDFVGGSLPHRVADLFANWVVAPIVNSAVGLVKGICTVVKKAAQGLNWVGKEAAKGLASAGRKVAEGLNWAGEKFQKFSAFLSKTLDEAKVKIGVAAKEAYTSCYEQYNKVVVKSQERYAEFQRNSSIGKGARKGLHTLSKITPGHTAKTRAKADERFKKDEALIDSEARKQYLKNMNIIRNKEVRRIKEWAEKGYVIEGKQAKGVKGAREQLRQEKQGKGGAAPTR